MRPFSICIFFIFLAQVFTVKILAQVLPRDGDTLNYRLTGFTVPPNPDATAYVLEIWDYSAGKETTVVSKPTLEKNFPENRMVEILPQFGKTYKWRVMYMKKKKTIGSTPFYTLTVRSNPFSDSNALRVRIINNTTERNDLFVFFDNTRTLYNLAGEALWFLPVIPGVTDSNMNGIRDIKVTADGTITFITNWNVFEIDYHGHVLWRGPNDGSVSRDTTEYYHHEFTKLNNGHYLAAGNKMVMRKIPDYIDSTRYTGRDIEVRSDGRYSKISFGTLLEYDQAGKVVWSWNSGDHFRDKDLFTPTEDGNTRPSTHMNSFYLDTQRNVFYTSYRDISRVIKAEYPSGKVLAQYGENYTHDASIKGDGMFYAQHSCRINKDGNLYLFNNNHRLRARNTGSNDNNISTVLVLQEPADTHTPLKKLWEYNCITDADAKAFSPGGGSVYELDNGDMLVCMGASNRNFIVSKNKQIKWNAVTEIKNQEDKWVPASGYRASPVYYDEIIKLLFKTKTLKQ